MKAFPTDRLGVIKDSRGISINEAQQDGMDLRDYFASKAMQAILAGNWNITDPDEVTQKSYKYADAMIKGRKL